MVVVGRVDDGLGLVFEVGVGLGFGYWGLVIGVGVLLLGLLYNYLFHVL